MAKRQEKIGRLASAAVVAALGGAVLTHTAVCADAVREGLRLCAGSVIPSLFPMMFLAQYFVRSGAAEEVGTLLEGLSRRLFGLSGACGAAVLVGMVGGYPAGAAAADGLVRGGVISREEGERLANAAFCSGPGFTVGLVGAALYQNKMLGLLILTAQVLSCIIILITGRLLHGGRKAVARRMAGASARSEGKAGGSPLVDAVGAASSAVLAMGGFIVLFHAGNALLDALGVNAALETAAARMGLGVYGGMLLPCLTEVTGGAVRSVKGGAAFTAFVVGFGGLSVHCQNFALCGDIQPRKGRYLLTRLAQGCLCAGMVHLALQCPFFARWYVPAAAGIGASVSAVASSASPRSGALLLLMCLMSVMCLPKKERGLHESFQILRQNRSAFLRLLPFREAGGRGAGL